MSHKDGEPNKTNDYVSIGNTCTEEKCQPASKWIRKEGPCKKKPLLIGAVIGAILVAIALALALYFTVFKSKGTISPGK